MCACRAAATPDAKLRRHTWGLETISDPTYTPPRRRLSLQGALHHDAHRHLAWLRREAPVYRARLGWRRDVYLITRYADVERLLKDDTLVKEPAHTALGPRATRGLWIPKAVEPLFRGMLTTDDPDHRRLRTLVAQAFTPRRIEELRPAITQLAAARVAELHQRRQFDLIEAFALPLPVHVITELVGIPAGDRPRFQAWVHAIVRAPGPLAIFGLLRAIRGFSAYVRGLARERRARPTEDLLSALVAAESDTQGFTEEELVAMVFLLLVAGHETTVSLIANGCRALLEHPEALAELVSEYSPDPDKDTTKDPSADPSADPGLLRSAIEEFLRFDGPLLGTELYYMRETTTLHGVTIPAGAPVILALLAANRDSAVFDAPDRLDLRRAPNRHLAFGKGIHHCLGAPLARLEAEVAFAALLPVLPHLELVHPAGLRYRQAMFLHRLEALPVRWRRDAG